MSVGVESLFTSALGLVAPWEVARVELDTARRRIDFEVICQAKLLDDRGTVKIVGIDDTSLPKGPSYLTVVHDFDTKRLLFATAGRGHQAVLDFAADLQAHGGDPVTCART